MKNNNISKRLIISEIMEAEVGIEPAYTALQCVATTTKTTIYKKNHAK